MLRTPLLTTLLFLGLLTGTAAAQQAEPLGAQLRLTQRGDDGDASIAARAPDAAYNAVRDEFLAVWENDTGDDTEIFGQRLSGSGTPIGPAFQISGAGGDPAGVESVQPAVAYDPERDRYGVAFVRELSTAGEREVFVQVVSADARLLSFAGGASSQPVRASDIGFNDEGAGQPAANPDIVYRPDTDGVAATPDAFVVAYDGEESDGEVDVYAAGLRATDGGQLTLPVFGQPSTGFDAQVSFHPSDEDGREPSLAVVPGSDDLAVAWEGTVDGDRELFAVRMPGDLPFFGSDDGPAKVTTTGPGTAEQAADVSLAADPGTGGLTAAYVADEINGDAEIRALPLSAALAPAGDDRQLSTAGPAGSGSAFRVETPSAAHLPGLGRTLVTWVGQDQGRPGTGDNEEEVMGVVVGAGAAPAGGELQLSAMGPPNDGRFEAREPALAVGGARWLSVWSGDDLTPPLADNEFELYGRQVGENADRDGDGALVPADCDDADAGVRPGATEVFDNGVDEDCSGGDAENPDRDGDGSPRPADCDDANPSIRPGITDVANNEVDEDCDARLRRTRVGANVERVFTAFRAFTRVTRLRVTRLESGMRIQLRCSGKGCPRALRDGTVRRVTAGRARSQDFTKLFKRARLKAGAVIDVRILEPGAIGRVDRFVMRAARLPKRVQRCLPPGVRRPVTCGRA